MRHFFRGDVLLCFVKISLKVRNPLYIQNHRIPVKAKAGPIDIHSGGYNARRDNIGFLVLNTKPGTEFDNYVVRYKRSIYFNT